MRKGTSFQMLEQVLCQNQDYQVTQVIMTI
jgi:hypothetical protein